MIDLSLGEKKQQIFENEEIMASQIARKVIEKPVPPVWMVLVPIFFVFYAWKVKKYSNGLKDFAKHYLISRRRALDTAYEAQLEKQPPEIDALVAMADSIPDEAKALYRTWMSLLVNHYHSLLSASGDNYHELIQSHYRNKTRFSLFYNQLIQVECAYNFALLPGIEGEQENLRDVLAKMKQGIKEYYQKEINEVFPR